MTPPRRESVCMLFTVLLSSGCGQQNPTVIDSVASSEHAEADGNSADATLSTASVTRQTPGIVRWVHVEELPKEVAIMESVFWEPADTVSLRQKILSDNKLRNSRVLEIGTGSGLLSLCCLQAGAAQVVATDLNKAAVQNAAFNAQEAGFAERIDVRLVPGRAPEAWTVIQPHEKFDLIVSNPPWENSQPVSVAQFALYDPNFALLDSLVRGARTHLRPAGRMWLAYGCVSAIRRIQDVAAEEQLSCTLLDDRPLESLPELFLPGLLIEITVPKIPEPE